MIHVSAHDKDLSGSSSPWFALSFCLLQFPIHTRHLWGEPVSGQSVLLI